MRSPSSLLPRMAFVLLLLLVAGQFASLGRARTVNREVERWKSEFSTPPIAYFSRISPSQEHGDNDVDDGIRFRPIHGVSKRLVPQGPNPLHN
ncbi:hypothetical protein MUK42_27403 [Musa troglodytarum]|uniref:Uncharacterized protein n=2 Tax=Musa troglodytarum TaxID=320322 RepID=A0A9E7JR62_9LILI|nr:hypothetical protein MUK42_27403 [Musa troglodytarum]